MYLATYALDSFVRGVSRAAELAILFPFSPEMRRLAVRALACQVVIATCPPRAVSVIVRNTKSMNRSRAPVESKGRAAGQQTITYAVSTTESFI